MSEHHEPLLPQAFIDKLNAVKNKRAKIVIEHILKFGSISTEDLKNLYGYNHPPRAAKDVRDEGIPLITFTVRGTDGRSIAAYKFGDPSTILHGREGGRRQLSKRFKQQLYEIGAKKCAICNGRFPLRELQMDHRIPYEIGGEVSEPEKYPNEFMLVCGSCNRAKSWSCENCPNWAIKDLLTCKRCYWANPLHYEHVATKDVRRTELTWQGDEVDDHNRLQASAQAKKIPLDQYIKGLLKGLSILSVLFLLIALLISLFLFFMSWTFDENSA